MPRPLAALILAALFLPAHATATILNWKAAVSGSAIASVADSPRASAVAEKVRYRQNGRKSRRILGRIPVGIKTDNRDTRTR